MKILSVNCYEAAFSTDLRNLYLAAPEKTRSFEFLSKIFPAKRIIPLSGSRTLEPFINDEEVITKTDIGLKAKELGMTHFLPSYRNSKKIESWARKNRLKILFSPVGLQKSLENKVYFDQLLKKYQISSPESWVLRSAHELKRITAYPVVVQLPESEGSEGTFIIRSSKELDAWWKKRRPKLVLVRKYIEGLPLGVTVIVYRQGHVVSALRAQVSTPLSPKNSPFGVQWLASSEISKVIKRNIETNLELLAQALRDEGYLGVANIDFILSSDRCYFIECNPRFSAATSQLASNPSLLNGLGLTKAHIDAIVRTKCPAKYSSLPSTSFRGCSLELTNFVKKKLKLTHKVSIPIPEIGYYALDNMKLTCAPHPVIKKTKKEFFFYTSLSPSKRIFEETSLASICTNFPCYNVSQHKVSAQNGLSTLISKTLQILR